MDGVSEAEVQRRCEQAAAEASAEGEESLNDLLVCLGQVARHTQRAVLCLAIGVACLCDHGPLQCGGWPMSAYTRTCNQSEAEQCQLLVTTRQKAAEAQQIQPASLLDMFAMRQDAFTAVSRSS